MDFKKVFRESKTYEVWYDDGEAIAEFDTIDEAIDDAKEAVTRKGGYNIAQIYSSYDGTRCSELDEDNPNYEDDDLVDEYFREGYDRW